MPGRFVWSGHASRLSGWPDGDTEGAAEELARSAALAESSPPCSIQKPR